MPATRLMPTDESRMLMDMVREFCDEQMRPIVDQYEAEAAFPREVFAHLGELGLLSLPYPEEFGGYDQPYEVYLQVIEETRESAWMSVAVGTSVHYAHVLPDVRRVRHRRAAGGPVAAGDALRDATRRLLPVRAAGRL
jgi:alkylation response protein AidB-like acyl-CoA dehydrogenase